MNPEKRSTFEIYLKIFAYLSLKTSYFYVSNLSIIPLKKIKIVKIVAINYRYFDKMIEYHGCSWQAPSSPNSLHLWGHVSLDQIA